MPPISIHVLSDSLGETGEMVARAVIAQFELETFNIERLPKVSTPEQLRETVRSHCGRHCIFFYTLVDVSLRDAMQSMAAEGVNAVDLIGPAVALLDARLAHALLARVARRAAALATRAGAR